MIKADQDLITNALTIAKEAGKTAKTLHRTHGIHPATSEAEKKQIYIKSLVESYKDFISFQNMFPDFESKLPEVEQELRDLVSQSCARAV